MADVAEIKDKLPIVLRSNTSGVIVRIDSISTYGEGIGVVIGSGNGVSLSGHKVGDHGGTWNLSNFSVFEGRCYE